MDEKQLEDYLWHLVDRSIVDARLGRVEDVGITEVATFEEADVSFQEHGLVISMRNGMEYQLPIMRSG